MIHVEFVFIKMVTMLFGLFVAVAAYRGYSRYGNRPLLYVSVGFLAISFGVGLEGFLFDFTPVSLYLASLIHSMFMVLGMALIFYAIYGGRNSKRETVGTVEES